jgi:hypothetical protein
MSCIPNSSPTPQKLAPYGRTLSPIAFEIFGGRGVARNLPNACGGDTVFALVQGIAAT